MRWGALLREFREGRGLSIYQLGLRAKISQTNLKRMEEGIIRGIPEPETVGRLADALGLFRNERNQFFKP